MPAMECDSKELNKSLLNENESTSTKSSDQERIRKLEAQVFQLKNVIMKLTGQTDGEKIARAKNSKKTNRPFDFSMYKKRHVLLHVSYFGWNYHGFAVQEAAGKTIESELFQALITTKLIESRETSNYHRSNFQSFQFVSLFHISKSGVTNYIFVLEYLNI
jgi:hypothetical protein